MHVFLDANILCSFYSSANQLNYLNSIKDLIQNQQFTLHITDNVMREFLCRRRALFLNKNIMEKSTVKYNRFTTISKFMTYPKGHAYPSAEIDNVVAAILRESKFIKVKKENTLKALSKMQGHPLTLKEMLNWEYLLQNLECDLHLISPENDYFYKNTSTIKEHLQEEWERNVFNPFKIMGYRTMSAFLIKYFPTQLTDHNVGEIHIEFLLKELPECKTFSKVHTIINKLDQVSFNPEQAEVVADNLINNQLIKLIIADHDMISFTQRFIENYELTIDSAKMANLKKILLKHSVNPEPERRRYSN